MSRAPANRVEHRNGAGQGALIRRIETNGCHGTAFMSVWHRYGKPSNAGQLVGVGLLVRALFEQFFGDLVACPRGHEILESQRAVAGCNISDAHYATGAAFDESDSDRSFKRTRSKLPILAPCADLANPVRANRNADFKRWSCFGAGRNAA